MRQKSLRLLVCCFVFALALFALCRTSLAGEAGAFDYDVIDGRARITGCRDKGVETLVLPAMLGGLPVADVAPGAFADCPQLVSFAAEEGCALTARGEALLSPDGATLLCAAPGAQIKNYILPEGILHIGAEAFKNQQSLMLFCAPAALESLGDRAFSGCWRLHGLYFMGDTRRIGSDLFQGVAAPAMFVQPGSALQAYCNERQLPCATIEGFDWEVPAGGETRAPGCNPPDTAPACACEGRLTLWAQSTCLDVYSMQQFYDVARQISEGRCDPGSASTGKEEICLSPRAYWTEGALTVAPEGLYGAGFAQEKIILRAYDEGGALTGWTEAQGDFVFGFDGAHTLGIEGSAQVKLSMIPIKPTLLEAGRDYYFGQGEWRALDDGTPVQWFIVPYNYTPVAFNYQRDYLAGLCWNGMCVADQERITTHEPYRGYTIYYYYMPLPILQEEVGHIAIRAQRMQTVKNELAVVVCDQSIRLADDYMDTLARMILETREAIAPYLSANVTFVPVTFSAKKDQFPVTVGDIIEIGDADLDLTAYEVPYMYYHELVHALDGRDAPSFEVTPPAFKEGMAEMLSEALLRRADPAFISYSAVDITAFLPDEAYADFPTYFCLRANRESMYKMGYAFVTFLRDAYGAAGISAMRERLNALCTERDMELYGYWDEQLNCALFTQALRETLGEDVFGRFLAHIRAQ